ncbi:MAG: carbohydrate ABC transporter permease [Anaerolineae bacterium]|nr:carbohydrate ABC transporter permease [Anaerolineae bacterium]
MHKESRKVQVLVYAALILIALFVLIPVWSLLNVAFDGSLRGAPVRFRLVPAEFSFDAFVTAWQSPGQTLNFMGLLKNSLIVSGGAAMVAVLFGMSTAYAFARYRFPGHRVGMFVLLLGALLPLVALMTPLFMLLNKLGIRTSLLGLMVAYTAFAMPFCVWNMRAAFQSIPNELEEAAFLDGASVWTTYWRVTLPLALPAIAVAALIAFLLGYTEFAIGWLFVDRPDTVTLAMAVSGMVRQGSREWSDLAALAVLMALPVVLIFILLRRYLLQGALPGVEIEKG